jgi:thiol-disulfide isomerase/thioredoxin
MLYESTLKKFNMETKWILLFFGFVLGNSLVNSSCKTEIKPKFEIVEHFNEIENIFEKSNDTTYVINFWATTCPPCLQELPHFETSSENHREDKYKTFLINIDEFKRIEKNVIPFLNKLKIKNDVYALIDDDMSSWTAKVNKEWYGALPYTVIYKGKNKKYFFGAFKKEQDLEKELTELLN